MLRLVTLLMEAPEVQTAWQIGQPSVLEYFARIVAPSLKRMEEFVRGIEQKYPVTVERMYGLLAMKDTTELPFPDPRSFSKKKSRRGRRL